MSEYVSAALRRLVAQRANQRCEYCLIHEDDAFIPHEPDHVVAVKHRGETMETNLAWTCFACNRAKGSDLSSIDPESNDVVRLFHPRKDPWELHFHLAPDGRITPLTNVGRVTESLLKLNRVELLEIRRLIYRGNRKPK